MSEQQHTGNEVPQRLVERARAFLAPQDVHLCVYHDPCSDGRGAAFAAQLFSRSIDLMRWSNEVMSQWKTAPTTQNPDSDSGAQSEAVSSSTLPDAVQAQVDALLHAVHGKNVVFLDCAPANELQWTLLEVAASRLMVLDHHMSNMQFLRDAPGCFFDMSRSGCGLAWDYFHGATGKPLPLVLQMVQKRDLWQIDPIVEAFAAWFYDPDVTPQAIQTFWEYYLEPFRVLDAISHGYSLLLKNKAIVTRVANTARVATLCGVGVGVVEVESFALVSDIGAAVSEMYGAAAIVPARRPTTTVTVNSTSSNRTNTTTVPTCMGTFVDLAGSDAAMATTPQDGLAAEDPVRATVEQVLPYKVSLRSAGTVDVSALATQFGGGGHRAAAGFVTTLPLEELFRFNPE